MKKLLISLGLALLLITPVHADDAIDAATSAVGEAVDAAGSQDNSESQVEAADTSNASEILRECSSWQTFRDEKANETTEENRNECIGNIQDQLGRLSADEDPTHRFFNPDGPRVITGGSGEQSRITNGCCYGNRLEVEFDEDNNCTLETATENCQLRQRELEIKKACICAEEPEHEICTQVFKCGFDQESPTAFTTDGPTPYESEFFDVTDTNKGLLTDDQGGSLVAGVNNEQGPVFAIVIRALNIMVGLASTVALVVLIIGAYMLITAQGGENQMEKGKNAILYSLLGLTFILMSYTIVRLVQSILF